MAARRHHSNKTAERRRPIRPASRQEARTLALLLSAHLFGSADELTREVPTKATPERTEATVVMAEIQARRLGGSAVAEIFRDYTTYCKSGRHREAAFWGEVLRELHLRGPAVPGDVWRLMSPMAAAETLTEKLGNTQLQTILELAIRSTARSGDAPASCYWQAARVWLVHGPLAQSGHSATLLRFPGREHEKIEGA